MTARATTTAHLHPSPPPVVDLGLLARSTAWVDAAPFRTHVRRLLADTGEHARVVALACGVAPATLDHLLTRHHGAPLRRIRARDAARLLTLDRDGLRSLDTVQVSTSDTARRIGALVSLGRSPDWIASQLRVAPSAVSAAANAPRCSALVELRAACACAAAGLTGWWSGDAWFDDAGSCGSDAHPTCTPAMPDWAA